MSPVPRFTPGRFTALWVVLRSLVKLGGAVGREELLSFARRDGLRSGGLPIRDGYQLGILGSFLREDGKVSLTELGSEALARGSEDEPSPEVLRLFASVLLLRHPPAWVAYWQGDPSALDLVLPDAAREILQGANLLVTTDPEEMESWALWDALKETPPFEVLAGQRKAIGEVAEELSFRFEKRRLTQEGYPDLAERIRWVAQESPAYGFDILSFCGNSRSPTKPRRQLAIEVKGQAVTSQGDFSLYLTGHEWKTAVTLGDQYVFYLWDGVRPSDRSSSARTEPLIISREGLVEHVPCPPRCGNPCEWKSAFIRLSL